MQASFINISFLPGFCTGISDRITIRASSPGFLMRAAFWTEGMEMLMVRFDSNVSGHFRLCRALAGFKKH